MARLIAFLLSMLLFCAPVMAESAPGTQEASGSAGADAAPSFAGVWQTLHIIRSGQELPEEEAQDYPLHFIFENGTLQLLYPDGESETIPCVTSGSTCTILDVTFILESAEVMLVRNADATLILQKVDPLMFNNPFLGRWNAEVQWDGSRLQSIQDYGKTVYITFDKYYVTLVDGDHIETYPCTYAGGACTIDTKSSDIACTLRPDGMLQVTNTAYGMDIRVLLSRDGEAAPPAAEPFLGMWMPLISAGLDWPPDARIRFERACLTLINEDAHYTLLCSYTPGGCAILENDISVGSCTIDENGLMTLCSSEDQRSWLIRETPAPATE